MNTNNTLSIEFASHNHSNDELFKYSLVVRVDSLLSTLTRIREFLINVTFPTIEREAIRNYIEELSNMRSKLLQNFSFSTNEEVQEYRQYLSSCDKTILEVSNYLKNLIKNYKSGERN